MSAYQAKQFVFENVPVHYLEGGAGMPLLLLHGSGPGASTIGNWRLILEPLAARYHVFAMDLAGFGLSGRRAEEPFFDVSFWLRQCQAMLALMPGDEVSVLGHSLSGALSLKLAASTVKIVKVMTTGTMGAAFTPNEATKLCWTFPQDKAALRRVAESLIYDHRHITEAYLDNRIKTLFEDAGYAPYFTAMFSGDPAHFVRQAIVTPEELDKITVPLTMLHGREDIPFPPTVTLALADKLRQADVILLAKCCHSIALEFPEKLLAAAVQLFG